MADKTHPAQPQQEPTPVQQEIAALSQELATRFGVNAQPGDPTEMLLLALIALLEEAGTLPVGATSDRRLRDYRDGLRELLTKIESGEVKLQPRQPSGLALPDGYQAEAMRAAIDAAKLPPPLELHRNGGPVRSKKGLVQ